MSRIARKLAGRRSKRFRYQSYAGKGLTLANLSRSRWNTQLILWEAWILIKSDVRREEVFQNVGALNLDWTTGELDSSGSDFGRETMRKPCHVRRAWHSNDRLCTFVYYWGVWWMIWCHWKALFLKFMLLNCVHGIGIFTIHRWRFPW